MAAGVVYVPFYATLFRQEAFAAECAQAGAIALRYGATRYQVHRSCDDRYRITIMIWFESKIEWYRYWEGPEMNEFRRRNSGRFQIPVTYVWHDELAAGELGPQAPVSEPEPEPTPQPEAAV